MSPARAAPAPQPAAARGFTLLEVMVALAILAGALMALSDVVGGALRNHVRAQQLEVATLLARGKMVGLEEEFERKGFRDFDQTEEGTFEDDGHPEIRWKAEAVKPEVDLSPQKILMMLTGSEDLSALLPEAPDEDGRTVLDPRTGALSAMVQAQLTQFGEVVKKGVRELRLTVSWDEGKSERSFTVVTHLVVLQPKETP
jgi:general secretion pathway protein I